MKRVGRRVEVARLGRRGLGTVVSPLRTQERRSICQASLPCLSNRNNQSAEYAPSAASHEPEMKRGKNGAGHRKTAWLKGQRVATALPIL